MRGPFLRKLLVIGALVSATAVLIRALRGRPVPAFARTDSPVAPWPTLRPEGTGAASPPERGPIWVEAPDGRPPESHPVKAKLTSGIYHLPGMMNYERTKPDRCYRTADDAEADGLRAAKR